MVIRRPAINLSAGSGLLLLAIGLGVMMSDFTLEGFGRVAVILGAGWEGFRRLDQRIQQRTTSQEETYHLGKDVGYELGFQEGQQAKPERPVLVDLTAAAARLQREREFVSK